MVNQLKEWEQKHGPFHRQTSRRWLHLPDVDQRFALSTDCGVNRVEVSANHLHGGLYGYHVLSSADGLPHHTTESRIIHAAGVRNLLWAQLAQHS